MNILRGALKIIGDVTGIGSVKDAVHVILGTIDGDRGLQEKMQKFELEKIKE
ncbi:unnamed protein product, partial [marine sediment metagenome]